MITSAPASADALKLYGGKDPRDLPRYTYPEAARATGVPATTIAAWVRGQAYRRKSDRGYFAPVIRRPSGDTRLSFFNLIEVHVLRSLRINPDTVKLKTVREAVTAAERRFGIERLLIHEELRTGAGELFLDKLSELEVLSHSQQLVMRAMLIDSLTRVAFDRYKLPTDLWPVERLTQSTGKRLILVSPFIAFGRPVVKRLGISTRAIADRMDAGESEEAISEDYGLSLDELQEALAYEAAA